MKINILSLQGRIVAAHRNAELSSHHGWPCPAPLSWQCRGGLCVQIHPAALGILVLVGQHKRLERFNMFCHGSWRATCVCHGHEVQMKLYYFSTNGWRYSACLSWSWRANDTVLLFILRRIRSKFSSHRRETSSHGPSRPNACYTKYIMLFLLAR